MKRSVLWLAFCFAARSFGAPSDTLAVLTRCALSIQTGPDTAWVYIDSCRMGTTPLTVDTLQAGSHIVRLLETDESSWLTDAIWDTLTLAPSEHRTLHYAFERRVLVITDPSGALIFVGDSLAGATPLLLSSRSRALPTSVEARENGYARAIISLPSGGSGIARAVLEKIWQSEPPLDLFMEASGHSDRTGLRLYLAGAATIASGITAAYFKIKADTRNSLFQASGDPALQNETHRFDNASALALVATEIGFAFFTYFLLAD